MQPMSSMQTTLLPGVTPGWNDPPPLGNPSSGSRLNRYRRVVDPSLTAAGGAPAPYAASPQQGMPMGMPQGMMQQPMQHMQPVQQQYYAQPGYSMPGSEGQGDGVPSAGYGNPQQQPTGFLPVQQQLPQQHMQQQYPQQQQQVPHHHQQPPPPPPAVVPSALLPSVPSTVPPLTVPPPSSSSVPPPPVTSPGPYPMSPYAQSAQMVTITHHTQYDRGEYQMQAHAALQQQQQQAAQMATHYSNQPSTHSSPTQGGYTGGAEENLLFSAPNAVPSEDESFVDPATFKPPGKAPGDVSLPGASLTDFLVKGALKLHQSKCQGVQVGLRGLHGEVAHLTSDDPFIKKFNYVIDAVDREVCEEGFRLLDELVFAFPAQTHAPDNGAQERKWVGAIRLLLKELPNKLRPH